eukprot:TRINITY_DN3505_c1_g3_i2.p1 TRINITY_DN3505_c1_g3~~TRINITY_DN3505_c1_g3_i2.p1  ORF type:complete len:333 (+),score=128.28 TRINITY_DN3505_c1_g3_i2:263-1261(+)
MNRISIFIALACVLATVFAQEIVPTFGTGKGTYYANGTLTFTCTAVGEVPTAFTIDSILYSDVALTTPAGVYNGSFFNNDGSFTRSLGNIQTSTNTGSLSNFLAYALRNNGTGLFDKVSFLTRYNATGGVAAACADATGVQVVPFNATYGFYQSIAPPVQVAGVTLRNTFRAVGVLNLDCSGTAPVISNIRSILYTVDAVPTQVGIYNGSFIATDESRTAASGPVSFAATGGFSLPYFLANATNTEGTGTFNGLSYITRYDTVGGVCGSSTGTLTDVPFEASYGFYAGTPTSSSSSSSFTSGSTNGPSTSASTASAAKVAGVLVLSAALLLA